MGSPCLFSFSPPPVLSSARASVCVSASSPDLRRHEVAISAPGLVSLDGPSSSTSWPGACQRAVLHAPAIQAQTVALFSQCLFLHPAWEHLQRLCRHEVLRSTAPWPHGPHGRVDGRLREGLGEAGVGAHVASGALHSACCSVVAVWGSCMTSEGPCLHFHWPWVFQAR